MTSPGEDNVAYKHTDLDLADSADILTRLIEEEQLNTVSESDDETESDKKPSSNMDAAHSDQLEKLDAEGLSGFQRWLARTRQVGRRASRFLEAIDSMHVPRAERERMADLVRLNLLLECNSAIGFNADGTLRNTEAVATVSRPEDDLESEDDFTPDVVRDDAEVLMTKQLELRTSTGSHSLLAVTVLLVAGSVVGSYLAPIEVQWHAEWATLVTSTAASLMISVAVFARVGRRHRSIEAYREMGKELQNNRIMLSTIKHG